MWKQISEWIAQGLVQAAISAVVAGVALVGGLIWDLRDVETLVGIIVLLVLFFGTFFALKLLHLPNFKSLTQAEYDALTVLGKLNKRTLYMIVEEKEPRGK